MLSYILEVSLCWSAFYLLYWLLLSRDTFFHFNRWYLVSTLLASLVIPSVEWELPQRVAESDIATVYFQPITVGVEELQVTVTATPITSSIGFLDVLTWIYWAGMAFCMLRFLIGMRQIYTLYRRSEKRYRNGYQIILSEKAHPPFSFFNSLFISKSVALNPEDREAILQHELAHIRGGHSYDILVLEILNAMFWCSPFIYLYRRSLRNVHEYIADAAVLRTTKKKQYGHLLIRQSQSGPAIAIANHFHSQLKKRILMMMRNPSKRQAMLKYLLVIPLTLLVLLVFSNAEAQASMQQQAEEVQQHIQDAVTSMNITSQEGTYSFKTTKGIFIDSIPFDGKSVGGLPEGTTYMIIYPGQNIFAGASNVKELSEMVRPDQIEKIEIETKDKLVKIWLKGSQEDWYKKEQEKLIAENAKFTSGITSENVLLVITTDASPKLYKPTFELTYPDGKVLQLTSKAIGFEYGKADLNPYLKNGRVSEIQTNGETGLVKIKIIDTTSSNETATVHSYEPALFPGCEGEKDARIKENCSYYALRQFIAKNIRYPKAAREQNIEGEVLVSFMVTESGRAEFPKIQRSIGKDCDEEVLRLINEMPTWTPAQKDGKPFASELTIPITFRLQPTDTSKIVFNRETYETHIKSMDDVVVVGKPLYSPEQQDMLNEFNAILKDIGKKSPEQRMQTLQDFSAVVNKYAEQYPEKKEEIRNIMMETLKQNGLKLAQPAEPGTKVEGSEVFKIVEEMPRFPGCEEEAGDVDAKKACADKRMLEYVYQNVKYPKEARENGVEGTVVVSFIIEKDGSISNPKAVRDIGAGAGEEAIRVINLMKEQGIRWTPGKQRGRAVRVQFNMPIRFKLNNEDKQQKALALQNSTLPSNTLKLQDFKVTPNPTTGLLNVSFKGEKLPTLVKVFDLQGKALQSLNLQNFDGSFSQQLDLSKAPKGTLIISVIQGEQVYAEKIILQ